MQILGSPLPIIPGVAEKDIPKVGHRHRALFHVLANGGERAYLRPSVRH